MHPENPRGAQRLDLINKSCHDARAKLASRGLRFDDPSKERPLNAEHISARGRRIRLTGMGCVMTAMLSSCGTMNHTQSGAVTGAGLGTLAGAVIGSHSGHAAGGALIGAATGGLLGGAIGSAEDAREERDYAVAQAAYAAQAQQALTNYDLIRLTQSGVGDDVIINMVNTRGGRFDLSPDAVIALKASGVSDRVVLAIQTASKGTPGTVAVAPVAAPGVVVLEPRPSFGVVVGSGPVYMRPYRHRHPRAGFHYGYYW